MEMVLDKRLRIFISGRVSGIKYESAQKNFRKEEKYWREQGYEVVNPLKLCKREWSWLRCMIVCLWHLSFCDCVSFMNNSSKSRGAKIEFKWAMLIGKIIFCKKGLFD